MVYDIFIQKPHTESICLLYKFTCIFIANMPLCWVTFLQELMGKWQRYHDLVEADKFISSIYWTCVSVEDDPESQEMNPEVTELSTDPTWIVISFPMQFENPWEANKHWFRMLSRCQKLPILTSRFISQMFIFH